VSKLPLTYLFVPGNRPERFAKALTLDAGAVILDLEDAVSPQDKAAAREAIAKWYRTLGDAQARILVRINDDSTAWFEDDLALLRHADIHAVVLPKTETGSQITRVRSVLPQDGYIVPLVETARGVLNLDSIAAEPGVQRLAFGTLDYAVDLDLSGDERGLLYPSCRMALASRVAGIAAPVAGVTPEIGDDVKLLADLAFARACGFGAKLCIHPRQVSAIQAALLPSAEEIAWAKRVVAAAEAGQGAVQVDGKMVDRPVIAKAMQILARAVT
jgi:citrate lyase subunit beta/citryl-CoA lyase